MSNVRVIVDIITGSKTVVILVVIIKNTAVLTFTCGRDFSLAAYIVNQEQSTKQFPVVTRLCNKIQKISCIRLLENSREQLLLLSVSVSLAGITPSYASFPESKLLRIPAAELLLVRCPVYVTQPKALKHWKVIKNQTIVKSFTIYRSLTETKWYQTNQTKQPSSIIPSLTDLPSVCT